MKNLVLAILLCFGSIHPASAQSFNWTKSVGSIYTSASSITIPGNEHTKYLCTDANKNLYAAILASDSGVLRADTFSQPGGKNFGSGGSLLLASYSCGGAMRWARLFENRGDVICYGIQYHAGSIYVAGRFGDTGSNPNRYIAGVKLSGHDSQHYFLARYDTLGNLNWIRFVGANDQSSFIKLSRVSYFPGEDDHSLGIDGNGDIHHFVYLNTGVKINPSMTAQKGTYDLKYDASGVLLTAVRLGVDSS